MNQADLGDIPIENSKKLDEDVEDSDSTQKESWVDSKRVLEQQGIFVIQKERTIETSEPLENLSRELFEEGGIEIIKNREGQEAEKYSL